MDLMVGVLDMERQQEDGLWGLIDILSQAAEAGMPPEDVVTNLAGLSWGFCQTAILHALPGLAPPQPEKPQAQACLCHRRWSRNAQAAPPLCRPACGWH